MRTRHVLVAAATLGLATLLAGGGAPLLARADEPVPGTVTVSGTGTVTAVPDTAVVSFGVVTQAQTATQALAANSAVAARVISALKTAGVATKDLQTEAVSLSPRYSDRGDEILGYTATNTVSATVRELGRAGAVIDAAVAAGANTVQGPSLRRSDADHRLRRRHVPRVLAARYRRAGRRPAASVQSNPMRIRSQSLLFANAVRVLTR